MRTITAVNVNDAYRAGLRLLHTEGRVQESRNGPVRVVPYPVTTRYQYPTQRVLFDAQRNANPFFHLFEAIWMLAGRNDLKSLTYFLPSFAEFSDDGKTLYGAYGHRWRSWISGDEIWDTKLDQLDDLIHILRTNPHDRRAVLAMWDPNRDLGADSKDIPCNDMIKFRIIDGALDMYVFNRSNDAIYGCYGANAVHFSFLQEYMAAMIGVKVGAYEQISTDFHAYVAKPYRWDQYWPLEDQSNWANPYLIHAYQVHPLVAEPTTFNAELYRVAQLVADETFAGSDLHEFQNPFFVRIARPMYQAFRLYKGGEPRVAAEYLHEYAGLTPNDNFDWIAAGIQWLLRVHVKRQVKSIRRDTE